MRSSVHSIAQLTARWLMWKPFRGFIITFALTFPHREERNKENHNQNPEFNSPWRENLYPRKVSQPMSSVTSSQQGEVLSWSSQAAKRRPEFTASHPMALQTLQILQLLSEGQSRQQQSTFNLPSPFGKRVEQRTKAVFVGGFWDV